MNDTEIRDYSLNSHERQLIHLLGNIFTIHGRSKNFGFTFAILQLKAPDEADGLDQEMIQRYIETNFHPVSISTISRILNQLTEQEYCDYVEERTHNYGRKRMKFFRKTSLKKVLLDRIDYAIQEFDAISTQLEKIKADALTDASNNSDLISLITYLQDVYSLSKKLYQRLQAMSESELRTL
jgi:DNA-binding PadR family transcriptional regulator